MVRIPPALAFAGCSALVLISGCRQASVRAQAAVEASELRELERNLSPAASIRLDSESTDFGDFDRTPPADATRCNINADLAELVATAADSSSTRQPADPPPPRSRYGAPQTGALVAAEQTGHARHSSPDVAIRRASFNQGEAGVEGDAAAPSEGGTRRSLVVPPQIPGGETPPFTLPPLDPNQSPDERREAIRQVYEALPELPPDLVVRPGTSDHPLTLADLQQTAYSRSPVITRAWADIDAARGRAVQAGLCPNPVVGYEGDTINTLNTAGYNGLFLEQTYVTAGKLDLAQQAALMEVRVAEYAYRRSRVEVAAAVRRAYFGVLIAQERVRLARAMSTLTEEAYNAQIELVAGGEAAAYEPLQLKVLALKARNDVVTAENAYLGSWRELAAALSYPDMQPVELAGSVEFPPGELQFEAARATLLSKHTDLSIAQAQISQQNFNLELQRVTPIPNLELYSAVQHDDTNSRNDVSYNIQIGLPLPLFNRNQGNISAANAELIRAQHNWVSTRNELSARLAEAFARYATARALAATYQSEIVPNQVQTFRGVYTQFREVGGEIDFAQVIVAQQTLAQVLGEYLNTLSNQWNAAVDLSEILQVEDIYTMDGIAVPTMIEGAP